MQTNYSQEMQPAIVGALADLVFKTTDSYYAEGDITAGVPVVPGTDAAKQIKVCEAGGAANVIGITQFVHKQVAKGETYYPDGYVVPVVTRGRVWVEVDGDVTAHTAAKYDPDKGVWSASGSEEISNAKFITGTTSGMAVVEIG